MPTMAFTAVGMKFSIIWMPDSPKAVKASLMPSPVPRAVRRFVADALTIFREPDMVVEASRAVVPAMPISSWTTWMAS